MKKKRIFHHFWGTIIKGNQKNFLEGESPHFKEFPHSDCLWSIRIFFSSNLRSSRNQTSLTEEIKSINRSSHRRSSVKKGVLKNFTKFTGKRLCQSLFFSKVVKKVVFLWGLWNFQEHLFTEHLWATASKSNCWT